MLGDLKTAHAELLACIAELETLTRETAPDAGKLSRIRWKLSRASGKRRRIVEEAIARLSEGASADEARRLSLLRENSGAMLVASSQHVGKWSLEAVLADWPGYCRASEAMRASMRERIAAEKSTLYPLLERAAI